MSEALVIGALGTAAGLALVWSWSGGLLGLVTRTINDLYFVLSVRDVALDPLTLGKGVLLGVGATLLAALAPAIEATGAPPRVVMSRGALETQVRRGVTRATWLGLGLGAAGAQIVALPAGIIGGFAGLFLVMIGAALVAPSAALVLLRVLDPIPGSAFGMLGRLATRGIVASLSRTSVAIAALMIAVSAAIGVGVMIASFRDSVVRWLDGTIVGSPGPKRTPQRSSLRTRGSLAARDCPRNRTAPTRSWGFIVLGAFDRCRGPQPPKSTFLRLEVNVV